MQNSNINGDLESYFRKLRKSTKNLMPCHAMQCIYLDWCQATMTQPNCHGRTGCSTARYCAIGYCSTHVTSSSMDRHFKFAVFHIIFKPMHKMTFTQYQPGSGEQTPTDHTHTHIKQCSICLK